MAAHSSGNRRPKGAPTVAERNRTEVRYCKRPGCSNRLRARQTKYCSNTCRAVHSHQLKTAEARQLAESQTLEQIRETVAPVVREMLTDKVLAELKTLTELIPEAIAALKRLMASDDPELQLKAATLLLRYTMGNSSIAPPPVESGKGTDLTVVIGTAMQSGSADAHIGAPPASAPALDVPEAEVVEEEQRECLECHLWKPASQFVGSSHRCQECHDRLMEGVRDRYGDLVDSVHASR